MATNTVIPVTSGVEGNIGSCSVVNEDFAINSFSRTQVAVNSCNGEVISQHTYFDWGGFGLAMFVVVLMLLVGLLVYKAVTI